MTPAERPRSTSFRGRTRDSSSTADLVLLAMGFVGPERDGLVAELGVRLTDRGNVWRDDDVDDEREGRVHRRRHAARAVAHRVGRLPTGCHAARSVDTYLMGHSELP